MNTNPTPSVFQFNTTELRVIQDEQGDLWFVAADVCSALEVQNVTQAVSRLDEDERSMFNIGRQGEASIINESGLYSLILGSRKPEAKKFKKWVTSEVLPTIRKTGRYETPAEPGITPAQQRQLQEAIAARFPDGKKRPYAWSRFNNHFQLGSYKQLPTSKTDEALSYIATMQGGEDAPTGLERAALEQLRFARFCLYFDADGKMNLKEIPAGARMMQDADIARIVGDPGAMVDRNLLPDIISAAANRLRG